MNVDLANSTPNIRTQKKHQKPLQTLLQHRDGEEKTPYKQLLKAKK
jgi:hypothetical protein